MTLQSTPPEVCSNATIDLPRTTDFHARLIFLLAHKLKRFRLYNVKQLQIAEVMSWLGKRSYTTRVQRFGIERLREIARQNGKKGGRPRKEQKATKP